MRNSLRITLLLLAAAASMVCSSVAQQAAPPAKKQAPAPPKSNQGAAPKAPRAPAKTQAPLTLKTPKEKASYAMGMNLGAGLRQQSIDVDPTILARGLKDAFTNGKTLLTEDEARAILAQLQGDLRKKQQELAQ